jgi:hypothetical protein
MPPLNLPSVHLERHEDEDANHIWVPLSTLVSYTVYLSHPSQHPPPLASLIDTRQSCRIRSIGIYLPRYSTWPSDQCTMLAVVPLSKNKQQQERR